MPSRMSAALSAMAKTVAPSCAPGMAGMIEASATRRLSTWYIHMYIYVYEQALHLPCTEASYVTHDTGQDSGAGPHGTARVRRGLGHGTY